MIFALVVPAISDSNVELLKQGVAKFTVQMNRLVKKDHRYTNYVISGMSVLSSLAQLCLASVGESHDEILNAIGLPNDDVIVEQFTNLTKSLGDLNSVELHLANKMYIREHESLKEEFVAQTKDVFNAEIQNMDFSQHEEALSTINSWVEHKTNNSIKELSSLAVIDDSTTAVLVSALYFKGKWLKTFEPSDTYMEFYLLMGEMTSTPRMYKRGGFDYGESGELDAKLLRMYFEGERAYFLIILPNEVFGIHYLVDNLIDPTAISKAVLNLQHNPDVEVQIPKFEFETETDLKKVLLQMNITKVFSPCQAQLKKMINRHSELSFSTAVHKVQIDVNEYGIDETGADAIKHEQDHSNPPQKRFIADRPFYFGLYIDDLIAISGVLGDFS